MAAFSLSNAPPPPAAPRGGGNLATSNFEGEEQHGYRTLGSLSEQEQIQVPLALPSPPRKDHCRALGIGLLQGPGRRQFLMSEVPLCEGIS